MRAPSRAVVLRTAALILLVAAPAATFAGAAAPPAGLADPGTASCDADADGATPAAVPWDAAHETAAILDPALGVDQAMLERLHASFAHLESFVDVHVILQGAPRFVALFDGPAPAILPSVDAPYPVTAETMVAAPLSLTPPAVGPSPAAPSLLPVAADAPADPPIIPTQCNGLRPGVGLNQGCTLAWMAQGSDGKTYAVSAGHCVSFVGENVGYGTVRYLRNAGVGQDFTVIEVAPSWLDDVSPSMCHWGGPTAMAASGGLGSRVLQYGMGLGFGTTPYTRPRPAVLYGLGALSYSMIGPQINGDSGSPTRLETGPAIGVHTHGLGVVVIGTGLGYGTRLSHGFSLAQGSMGVSFSLLTAPEA